MAWSFVGASSTVTSTLSTITLTEPAGVAQGDLLVAVIAYRSGDLTAFGGTGGSASPTGWTLVQSVTNNSTATNSGATASIGLWYCIRGASAPSLTWTKASGPNVALGNIVAYRGVSGATPVGASWVSTQASGVTNATWPTFTTTAANSLVVLGLAGGQEATVTGYTGLGTNTSSNAPDTANPSTAEWKERVETTTVSGADTSLAIADYLVATSGTSSALTTGFNISARHAAIAVEFEGVQDYTLTATPTTFTASGVGRVSSFNSNKSNGTTLSQNNTVVTMPTGQYLCAVVSDGVTVSGGSGWIEFYIEPTAQAVPDFALGDLNLSSPTAAFGTTSTSGVGLYSNSTVFKNNVLQGTAFAFTYGDRVAVIVDGANLYFSKNGGTPAGPYAHGFTGTVWAAVGTSSGTTVSIAKPAMYSSATIPQLGTGGTVLTYTPNAGPQTHQAASAQTASGNQTTPAALTTTVASAQTASGNQTTAGVRVQPIASAFTATGNQTTAGVRSQSAASAQTASGNQSTTAFQAWGAASAQSANGNQTTPAFPSRGVASTQSANGNQTTPVTATVTVASAQTASGALTAPFLPSRGVAAAQTASGALAVDATHVPGGTTYPADAAFTASGSQTTNGGRVQPVASAQTSSGSQAIAGDPIRGAASAQTASGAQTTPVTATVAATITFTASGNQTTPALPSRGVDAAFTASGNQTTAGWRSQPIASAFTANGTQAVAGVTSTAISASFTASGTQATAGDPVRGVASAQSAAGNQTTPVTGTFVAVPTFTASGNQTTLGGRVQPIASAQTASGTEAISAIAGSEAAVNFTASGTQALIATVRHGAVSAQTASGTQTTPGVRVQPIASAQTASGTLTVPALPSRGVASAQTASGTETVTTAVTRGVDSAQTATGTLTATTSGLPSWLPLAPSGAVPEIHLDFVNGHYWAGGAGGSVKTFADLVEFLPSDSVDPAVGPATLVNGQGLVFVATSTACGGINELLTQALADEYTVVTEFYQEPSSINYWFYVWGSDASSGARDLYRSNTSLLTEDYGNLTPTTYYQRYVEDYGVPAYGPHRHATTFTADRLAASVLGHDVMVSTNAGTGIYPRTGFWIGSDWADQYGVGADFTVRSITFYAPQPDADLKTLSALPYSFYGAYGDMVTSASLLSPTTRFYFTDTWDPQTIIRGNYDQAGFLLSSTAPAGGTFTFEPPLGQQYVSRIYRFSTPVGYPGVAFPAGDRTYTLSLDIAAGASDAALTVTVMHTRADGTIVTESNYGSMVNGDSFPTPEMRTYTVEFNMDGGAFAEGDRIQVIVGTFDFNAANGTQTTTLQLGANSYIDIPYTGFHALMESHASMDVVAGFEVTAASAQASSATMAVEAGYARSAASSQTASGTQTTAAGRVQSIASAQTSSGTMAVSAVTGVVVSMSASATQAVAAGRRQAIDAAQSASGSFAGDITLRESVKAAANLTASGNQTLNAGQKYAAFVAYSASGVQQTLAGRPVTATCFQSAAAAMTVVARVDRFFYIDVEYIEVPWEYRDIIVPAERQRFQKVLDEDRWLTVSGDKSVDTQNRRRR